MLSARLAGQDLKPLQTRRGERPAAPPRLAKAGVTRITNPCPRTRQPSESAPRAVDLEKNTYGNPQGCVPALRKVAICRRSSHLSSGALRECDLEPKRNGCEALPNSGRPKLSESRVAKTTLSRFEIGKFRLRPPIFQIGRVVVKPLTCSTPTYSHGKHFAVDVFWDNLKSRLQRTLRYRSTMPACPWVGNKRRFKWGEK